MKTLFRLLNGLFLLACVAMQVNCSNPSRSSTPTATATNNGYYMQNGTCFSITGQVVDPTYCTTANNGYTCYTTAGQLVSNTYCTTANAGYTCYNTAHQPVSNTYCSTTTTNNGYYWQGQYCYNSANQLVSNTYCQTTSGTGTQCNGLYYYPYGYSFTPVYCSGANCRGYTLYTQSGYPVVCQ